MDGSACAASRVLGVAELLGRERHVQLLLGLRARRGERTAPVITLSTHGQCCTAVRAVTEISSSSAVDTIRFAWPSGDTGTIELTWDGQPISRLAIIFDR